MEFLDVKRLGKQRVEAAQILEMLTNKPVLPKNIGALPPFTRDWGGWSRHPAVLMWKGHEEWLKLYLHCSIGEWESRYYNNNIVVPDYDTSTQKPPPWLGYEPFHLSHRSNLLRKDSKHYRQFWPDDPDDLDYFWPTKSGF
jgi:hypothetical protein